MTNCSSIMQDSSANRLAQRNLDLYERAGPFTLDLDLDSQSRTNTEAEIREFLWKHWHQRRLGHLVATWYSKEGEPSTSAYFVEPDEKGIWHIAITINRTLVERTGSKRQLQNTIEYDAYSIERVDVSKGTLGRSIAIPEGETRSPQSYRLRLKDKHEEVLTEI